MYLQYCIYFFFFNDTATTEIYTLSLHDALPIYSSSTALSSCEVRAVFTDTQPRCSAPATVPPDAGSPPSLRISASSSRAATPHSVEWRMNRALRSGESAFSEEVRKPYSPSQIGRASC